MVQEHSSKYHTYNDEYTSQKTVLAKMELQLELEEARVAREIRAGKYPGADGKITEGAIKEIINADEDLHKIKLNILEQKDYVAKLWAIVDAFQHRKYNLNKAVDLWISGYYADPKPTKKTTGKVDQMSWRDEEEQE